MLDFIGQKQILLSTSTSTQRERERERDSGGSVCFNKSKTNNVLNRILYKEYMHGYNIIYFLV